MTENVTKSRKTKEKKNKEIRDLIKEYREAVEKLDVLKNRFDYITEPKLIEACVYEIKAEQARYSYLLERLKNESVCANTESVWRR